MIESFQKVNMDSRSQLVSSLPPAPWACLKCSSCPDEFQNSSGYQLF